MFNQCKGFDVLCSVDVSVMLRRATWTVPLSVFQCMTLIDVSADMTPFGRWFKPADSQNILALPRSLVRQELEEHTPGGT